MANFIERLGSALLAFGSSAPVQKSAAWPFDRVPVLNGNAPANLDRPYEQSVWVQRAIKEIAGPIAAVELKFYEGDNEVMDAPWLGFWEKPTPNLMLADFVEALTGWLKLAGEAFIILQPEFAVPFPEAAGAWPPLMLARPDCMVAMCAADGSLIAWEYRGPKGKRLIFQPNQVIQQRYWNPYDDLRGMSEYEAARVATEADYLAGRFALNLSRANGDTGVIVSVRAGTTLDDIQQKQITDSLRLKQQRSQRGEFSSVFVPADLEVQDPKVRAPDAQFVAQRLQNRHEIYIAFGVPPSMADVVASYSVGSASDWYRLITGTCVPTAAKIADAIGQIASRMHGRPVEAYFEFDDHPVMQQVRRERIDAGTKLWDRGVPWKDASEYLDLDLPRFAGDDTGYISFGLAPIGEAAAVPDPQADPALADTEEEDPLTEAIRALRARKVGRASPRAAIACDCCDINLADLTIRAGDSHDLKLWKSHAAKRRVTIRAFESKFNQVLMVARVEVLGKLERADQRSTPKLSTKAVAADFLFDLQSFTEKFTAAMRGTSLNALQTAGEQLLKEIGRDDPWSMPSVETIRFLHDRQNALRNVPDDIFERIKGTLTEGITNGESLTTMAANVRAEFNAISKGRAMTIASTETAAAYGKGRDVAMQQAGVQFKQWLVSGNSNVRPAHQAMAGATVPVAGRFLVLNPKTGESDSVAYPGDTSGAPWNVINCHCVAISVAPPEETPA